MNFLYPGFLFALLAIAIPIVIHLFNFRKYKKVYFSNVAFLKEVKEQNSSRQNLKNLLILLCRILAIIFLVFAFARPYFTNGKQADRGIRKIISVFVDNSYSMDAVNKEGSLLDEAKRTAKKIVGSYELNDKFQLLTNDFEGKHQRLLNKEEILSAIDEIKVSPVHRELQQVINRQQAVFSGEGNYISYVISDFQVSFAGKEPIKKEENNQISLIKLNANALPNIAVDSVGFLSPVHLPGTSEKMVVKVRNYSDGDAQNIPLKLLINNQQKAVANVTVKAGQSKYDTLSFNGLTAGWQKAVVSIKDFPLTFDDNLNFTFNVNQNQSVLVVNGKQELSKYIDALYGADPYFNLIRLPENNINYALIPKFSLVILNALQNPSTGLANELKKYINNGGSVVIFPDISANKEVYNEFLKILDLPTIAQVNKIDVKVSQAELRHPLFKDVFEQLPEKMDLPQVHQYFNYGKTQGQYRENLMQLPLGNSFLTKFSKGIGNVYLFSSGLNETESNFARHPLFIPVMYKIAFASAKDLPLFYTVGKDHVIETAQTTLGKNQTLKIINNDFEVIPEVKQNANKTLMYIDDQIKKAGFYEVKKADSTLAVIAFNDDRSESLMKFSTQDDLEKLFGKQPIQFTDTGNKSIQSAVEIKNNGTELWKLCLILCLVSILTEILLIRFYKIQKHTHS
ncbi:BatA domain-containing protein [Pedobacter sp.]|uniref:BatA domain-containing protein n=1 Tax=Pedobacter sp. TaxID=1411316 RepID=UPI00396D0275